MEEYRQGCAKYGTPIVFKKKFRVKCAQIDKKSGKRNLLGDDMLRFAYWYAKDYLHSH